MRYSWIAAGRAQVLGLTAQITAALPIVLLSIYVARSMGLRALAEFTFLVGASAILQTVAQFGLRVTLLRDRHRRFSVEAYVFARLAGVVSLSPFLVLIGLLIDANFVLVVVVLLLRSADSLMDMVLGFDQVVEAESRQLNRYTFGQLLRLLAVGGVYVLLMQGRQLSVGGEAPLVVAVLLGCLYPIWQLGGPMRQVLERANWLALFLSFKRLVIQGLPFVAAQVACALMVSLPRLALPSAPDQEQAGAAAAALTVSTVAGMGFYASWLRWSSRLSIHGIGARAVFGFLSELTLLLFVLLLLVVIGGVWLVTLAYGIDPAAWGAEIRGVLIGAVLVAFVMSPSNLFKFTSWPWFESAVYMSGVTSALAYLLLADQLVVATLLMSIVAGMAISQLVLGVFWLLRRGRNEGL